MTNFDYVKDMLHDVNKQASMIESVADETNLLSLNASIEASRAGEHGKGFAVVANEIKKLAENTKEQVSSIQNIVNGLNEKIFNTSSQVDHVINNFSNSKTSIKDASSGIKSITSAMGNVGYSFTSISANIEEQTATTQEMSSNLQFINEKAEDIDDSTMIELSITDHLMWKWRVYNLILGYVKLEVSSVGDCHGCRLGKWLDTLEHNNSNTKCIVDKIKKPHSNIHELAKKAIIEHEKGNMKACEKILEEIEQNSKLVVECLKELKAEMQSNNASLSR